MILMGFQEKLTEDNPSCLVYPVLPNSDSKISFILIFGGLNSYSMIYLGLRQRKLKLFG